MTSVCESVDRHAQVISFSLSVEMKDVGDLSVFEDHQNESRSGHVTRKHKRHCTVASSGICCM